MTEAASLRTGRLILVPAVISLGVTLLRLAGELLGWSPALFSREAGGGGSLVGIAWLVPVFGAWFGWRLVRSGVRPGHLGRAFGLLVLAFALLPLAGFVATRLGIPEMSLTVLVIYAVVAIAGLAVAFSAWPSLARVLLAYALAARIPVALVMLFAILGNWGTHYDVPPPGAPEMAGLWKWFMIGLLPQMTVWLWFTVVVGGLFGLAAAALASRRRPSAA